MIVLNRKQQRLPPGGHHFPEQGMIVRSETFEGVVKRVAELRVNNMIPMGNPEQDVLRYYAEKFPQMVMLKEDVLPNPIEKTLYQMWSEWVRDTWRKAPTKIITEKEASYRWEACKDCPRNKKFNWDESEESTELARRVFLMRQGKPSPNYLGVCTCHKADLGTFTFLDEAIAHSKKSKEDHQPAQCFVSDGPKA